MKRVVCWFSCGATSAVATKIVLDRFPDATIAYCDTGSEHDDNKRFIQDCEAWFNSKITILKSEKYADIWEVFEKTQYLVGVKGARCTTELKKLVRRGFEKEGDLQVFGFDSSEVSRANRFQDNNPEVDTWFPLIEKNYSKSDCLAILQKAGIRLPEMYRLGYRNNNCIGCVKGGAGYWNKIRRDFPDTFERMAQLERRLDVAILRAPDKTSGKRVRIFLDKLDPNAGKYEDLEITCGLFCGEI